MYGLAASNHLRGGRCPSLTQLTLQVIPVIGPDGVILCSKQIVSLTSLVRLALGGVDLGKEIERMARQDISLFVQRREFVGEGLEVGERHLRLVRDTPEIVPRTLVLRGLADGLLRESTTTPETVSKMCFLPLSSAAVDTAIAQRGRKERRERRKNSPDLPIPDLRIPNPLTLLIPINDKEPMVPRAIVPHIRLDQRLGIPQLALAPQPEPPDQPLAITPHVVVFGVLLEHLRDEVGLARARVQAVDDELAVVPDLVVFLVLERRFV